jgi:hypothetical protein
MSLCHSLPYCLPAACLLCLSLCLSICLPVCLSVVWLAVCLSRCLSVCLSICSLLLLVCLSLCLSICLSVCLCLQIEYPWRLLINPVDTCIDALVIRGALQMSRFLAGEGCPAIAWLEERQGESDLIRPGHSLRTVVAPAAALSLICFRTSFLPRLFDLLDYASATGGVVGRSLSVSYRDADSVFQTHPFFYACGTAFAALVSIVRRMHLLL